MRRRPRDSKCRHLLLALGSQPSDAHRHRSGGLCAMYEQQLTELMSNYGDIFEMWFDGTHAPTSSGPTSSTSSARASRTPTIKQGPRSRRSAKTSAGSATSSRARRSPTGACTRRRRRPMPAPRASGSPSNRDIPMVGSWFWDGNGAAAARAAARHLLHLGRPQLPSSCSTSRPIGRGLFGRFGHAPARVPRRARFYLQDEPRRGQGITAANVRGNDTFYGPRRCSTTTRTPTGPPTTPSRRARSRWTSAPSSRSTSSAPRSSSPSDSGSEYEVEVSGVADGGAWRRCAGTTIGYRKLDRFPKLSASKVRVTITKALACPCSGASACTSIRFRRPTASCPPMR